MSKTKKIPSELQRLPLNTQSFDIIREKKFIYIDKTEYILKMLSQFRIVFLSRPRRFGKSLMVSVINELFNGRKDLFKGLYIYNKWDWTKTNPVIKIDWTVLPSQTQDSAEEGLVNYLKEIAVDNGIKLNAKSSNDCFRQLITKLHSKYGRKVVILIDEYDKPVTDNITSPELDKFIRIIHDFYQVMKGTDSHIEFVFLTGVSKMSGLSVFSALNNIEDVSLNPDYAGICGYSQKELESNFSAHIKLVADQLKVAKTKLLKEINYWYDGYSWDGKTFIHNPYSVINFFNKKNFASHWFGTGTPRMLFDIIGRIKKPSVNEDTRYASWNTLDKGYDPFKPNETVTLFQTGYLTVKNINEDGYYELKLPNTEVEIAYSQSLLDYYDAFQKEDYDSIRYRLIENIRNNNPELLANTFKHILELPYQIKGVKENNYHSLLYVSLKSFGFKIDAETSTEKGRIDAVMHLNGLTVITEIKQSERTKADTLLRSAIKQIHNRKYYEKYLGKITLLAVAFGKDNEVKCKMEYMER